MANILLVDDDLHSLDSTRRILEMAGHSVITAKDGMDALRAIRSVHESAIQLVVTDVRMPQMNGLEFFRALLLSHKSIPVILMTAFGLVEEAVWTMKMGAVDFLIKPFKRQALLTAVESALKRVPQALDSASPQTDLLLGASECIQKLREQIRQIAPSEATVLLTGESGTGKELAAREIHRQSSRVAKPFVVINCGAIPEHLIESELFGHVKGAFSGATQSKTGLFEAADGGTLFLDEIGDMPLSVQVKVLRVLQEGEVRRVGSTHSIRVNVRVISATHKDLKQEVIEQRFRQDLLFRLDVLHLSIPALRERGDDVLLLANHFLKSAAAKYGAKKLALSERVVEIFKNHRWPGNVRELSNTIERAVVFSRGADIQPEHLPDHLAKQTAQASKAISIPIGVPLREVEDLLIQKTLEATEGDKNMTAKLLGINSRTIYRRLEKIQNPESSES